MSMETELNLSLTPGVASRLATHRLRTEVRPLRQRVARTAHDNPEPASEFPRGYGVLADQPLQVVKAAPVDTDASMSVIAGFRTIALACLRHLQSNERGVCESDDPEFVHQARVAIRRLRSAIRVWQPRLPESFVARFDPLWQALARQLGETRNWDVFLAETLPTIIAAFPECPQAHEVTGYARRRCAVNRQVAGSVLSAGDYSRLLLDFTAAVQALPERETRLLDVFAPRCLDKRARKVWQLAQQALTGDAAARHRLRVAYKRLRYALEFFAPLFPGDLLRQYHLAASGLQEMLGQLNDLAVARELIDEVLPGARGDRIRCWLDARSDGLLPQLEGLLGDFHGQRVPWQQGS